MSTDAHATQKVASTWQHAGTLGRAIETLRHVITSGVAAPLAVAAYVVLAPVVGSYGEFEVFNGQRVLQLGVLGVVSLTLLFREARARWVQAFRSLPGLARLGLGAVFLAGGISAWLAPLPRFAFLEVALFALLLVTLVALLGQFQRDPERARALVLVVLAAGASLYVLSFAVGYVFSLVAGLPVWPSAFTGFPHVRLFNQYQVWAMPFLVLPAALLPVNARGFRFSLHALVALWYALLYASGGRGAVLALVVSLLMMLAVYRGRAFPWARLQLAAAVWGLVLYVLLFVVLADNLSVFSRLQEGGDTGRLALWALTLEMIGQAPWLGEGPMQFAHHVNVYAAHPHNAVLQWASEWGIPSAVVLFGLVGWGFVAWVQRCTRDMAASTRPDDDLFRVAMTASLLAAAMYSLVDGVIVTPLSQLLLVATVAWAIAGYQRRPVTGRPRAPRARWSVGLLMVVLAVWGGVGYGVFPDVSHLEELQDEHIERTRPEILQPRFWQQGVIGTTGERG